MTEVATQHSAEVRSENVDAFFMPAPWVCFRTWLSNDGAAKSMISNERSHQIAVLEDESARLWHQIEDGSTRSSIVERALDLGVAEEVDEFLSMLCDLQLIIEKGSLSLAAAAQADPAPLPKQLEEGENTDIEHDTMQWVADHGFLFGVHWEVTYRCNERCIHCYNPGAAHMPHEKPERETNELSTDEAIDLLDHLREAGVFRLTLSGGEVTLRKDFWELVEAARKRGFSVNLYTNGLKLDDDACEKLAALWPTTVSVSVYSADEKAHDDITRVPSSYRRSIKVLETLRSKGIKTFLKSTQMHHTLSGYKDVRNLSERLGAGAEIDMMMSAAADGASAPLALAAKSPEELVLLAATAGSPLFVGSAATNWGKMDKDPNASVCGAGVGSLSLDPEGNVLVCSSMPLPAGNHRKHGFINIWRSSRHYRKTQAAQTSAGDLEDIVSPLSHWQGIVLKDFHECGTHRRCGWCAKCPGLAMLEHGDPLAPSTTNCRLATARMVAADLLSQGYERAQIAENLGVDEKFGELRPRVIPIIEEKQRGTGFNPTEVALKTLESRDPESPKLTAVLHNTSGKVILRRGTQSTADALHSFEELKDRVLGSR